MEEAVVEALVLVALITITTVLGSYFAISTGHLAANIQENSARQLKLAILWSAADACYMLATEKKPFVYNTSSISLALTGHATIRASNETIEISPRGRTTLANITLDELRETCSRAVGRAVEVKLVPGVDRGNSLTLTITWEPGNSTFIVRPGP